MLHDCAPQYPPLARAIKVLIVEDDLLFATTLEEALTSWGYSVTGIATAAVETLQQVEQDRPDVVLMDIGLPGRHDGITTATLLWDMFQLPTVYLTARSDQATKERAQARLPFGYLVKPVQQTDLVTAIDVAYQCSQAK